VEVVFVPTVLNCCEIHVYSLLPIPSCNTIRFDELRPGEPARKLSGKKRSFRDNIGTSGSDKDAMKSQLRFVADKADKKARGVTNSLASYEGIIPDAPGDSFRQRKGKGKAPKGGDSRGGGGSGGMGSRSGGGGGKGKKGGQGGRKK
jgi:uncharacterized membrane protein YgcG